MKKGGVAFAGISLLPEWLAARPKTGKKPNLIYVFPDQMRRQAMGFWKKPEYASLLRGTSDPVHTPNLDRFADESLVFTQAVSTTPLSSPHRAMLFSGKYPHKNGVKWNCRADRENQLDPRAECLGDVLKKSGYSCGYIGKYHLDRPEANDPDNPGHYVNGSTRPEQKCWDAYTPEPLRHGFDYWHSYGTFDVHKNPHYWDSEGKKHEPGIWSPIHEADKAISYIRNEEGQRDEQKPFFLVVSMNPPHGPYHSLKDTDEDVFRKHYSEEKIGDVRELLNRPNIPEEHRPSKRCVRYYASHVSGVDREFGRIVEAVEKKRTGGEHNSCFCLRPRRNDGQPRAYGENKNLRGGFRHSVYGTLSGKAAPPHHGPADGHARHNAFASGADGAERTNSGGCAGARLLKIFCKKQEKRKA